MRKIYALMVLLFAVLQLPAQVLVQGRPHPTAKPQMVSPRAIADGTFTMDMIFLENNRRLCFCRDCCEIGRITRRCEYSW